MVPEAEPLLPDAAVVVADGRIGWSGRQEDLPEAFAHLERRPVHGRLVTPALIDCHTHLVHGGHRAAEWEARLRGDDYAAIARRGGGILSTVAATRAADEDALVASALRRLDALLADGVATVEVKSGYGLDRETELRMLRAARRLERERTVTVRTTFLGAHAVPPTHAHRPMDYIAEIAVPALRAAHAEGLADAVDGFCEGIAFGPAEIARLFAEARALGLPVKLHAEQLSHTGGARLAAAHGALSADHLEHATEEDAEAMARAGTVAVLLPGAAFTLRETKAPPVEAFRARGVPMAVATDCNPGSSPLASLRLAMTMACTLWGLSAEEALAGATCHAARALGLSDRGAVAPGLRADLAIWDAEEPAELPYRMGQPLLHGRIVGGVPC
nr:imidazolonepropionase [Rubellimicrobium sp. CFH 75288]